VVKLLHNTITIGVIIAPPAKALAKSGTNVPWRNASLIEFQLVVRISLEMKDDFRKFHAPEYSCNGDDTDCRLVDTHKNVAAIAFDPNHRTELVRGHNDFL